MDQIINLLHPTPDPASPEETFAVPAGMRQTQFHAMGTTISLIVPAPQSGSGTQLAHTLFSKWEQTLSRFLPESELSRLNRTQGKPVMVSELLYTVLNAALAAASATNGLYDPTMLKQLVAAGYDRSFDQIAPVQPASLTFGLPGGAWQYIRLDPALRRVTLPRGIGLDFGGIAKGMAVDATIAQLQQAGVSTALVNAGGDIAVSGVPVSTGQWQIAVPGKDVSWTIPLHHGAMATSGIAHRQWRQGRQLRHHLLDPRTGTAAQSGLWSVTVVAARCEQAEVAAKVAFIRGLEQGAHFLRTHRLAGLLVCEDGKWETVPPWPVALMRREEEV